MGTILNDPLTEVVSAFQRLYPDQLFTVLLVASLTDMRQDDPQEVAGWSEPLEDGSGAWKIILSCRVPLGDLVAVLIHELAHVATKGCHGDGFNIAAERILNEYLKWDNEYAPRPNLESIISETYYPDNWSD